MRRDIVCVLFHHYHQRLNREVVSYKSLGDKHTGSRNSSLQLTTVSESSRSSDGYFTKDVIRFNEKYIEALERAIAAIHYMLPIRILYGVARFSWLTVDNDQLNISVAHSQENDFTQLSFQHIKQYAKKNELRFLNEEYFNNIKTKLLLNS